MVLQQYTPWWLKRTLHRDPGDLAPSCSPAAPAFAFAATNPPNPRAAERPRAALTVQVGACLVAVPCLVGAYLQACGREAVSITGCTAPTTGTTGSAQATPAARPPRPDRTPPPPRACRSNGCGGSCAAQGAAVPPLTRRHPHGSHAGGSSHARGRHHRRRHCRARRAAAARAAHGWQGAAAAGRGTSCERGDVDLREAAAQARGAMGWHAIGVPSPAESVQGCNEPK